MKFSISKSESYAGIKVLQETLDSLIAADLKSELVAFIQNGAKNILLDLTICKSCDSSGMSALLLGNRLCREANENFVLLGSNKEIKSMIILAGLDSQLNIVDSETEAEQLLI